MKGSFYAAVILMLVLASTAFGQYEVLSFDFCGGGARAEGMGKAYLGVSDDITGGGWNPAGLYTIDKPVLGVTWGSLAPRGAGNRITFNQGLVGIEHTGSFAKINSLNFVAPLRIKGHHFVGSFNYTRNFDAYQYDAGAYAGMEFINEFVGSAYLEQQWQSTLEGSVNSVNIAIGTRLYQKISFGFALNVYTGKLLREFSAYSIFPEMPIGDGMQTAVYEMYQTITDTNKVSGINFTTGLKYSGEKLGIGLMVRSPFKMNFDNDTTDVLEAYLNGLPSDPSTRTLYDMNNLTQYDIPWMVGLGFAYNVNENFLVAADMEMRAFKGGKVYVRDSLTINPGGDNIEYFTEHDPFYENVFAVRLGAEYLKQTKYGQVPLRAGLGYCPIPDPDYDENGETSQAVNYTFSLGSGIHWEQIRFDVAYSLATLDRSWFNEIDYTARNHHLNVSFTGIF
jgi:long-subunit fatty acid transport protein